MASRATQNPKDTARQLRNSAVRHALSIEEKKRMRDRVADLIIEAYDLPSSPESDPAQPSLADITKLQECLKFFQPSDLDDLVKERNIDNRCGYALCPRPNRRIPGGGEKVWNQKGGRDFKLLSKAEIEKWCSNLCADRTAFVRAQLSSEPSWLRESQNDVKLLDQVQCIDDLTASTKALSIASQDVEEMANRLQELSMGRGETQLKDVSSQVSIVEKDNNAKPRLPPNINTSNVVEGYQPRKVRFAEEHT
jgi:hypothetical protein